MSNKTLYATLRFKRRPISNDIISLQLRVAPVLPVHKYAIEEMDLCVVASQREIDATLEGIKKQHKYAAVLLDTSIDVAKRIARNS